MLTRINNTAYTQKLIGINIRNIERTGTKKHRPMRNELIIEYTSSLLVSLLYIRVTNAPIPTIVYEISNH